MSAARKPGGRRAPLRHATGFAIGVLAVITSGVQVQSDALATTLGDARFEVLAAPSTSGTVLEGQPLTVRVTLSNAGSQATEPLSVELRLDGARPANREDLAAWFVDDTTRVTPTLGDVTIAARASVASLDPGASAVLDLTVMAGSPLWGGPFGPRLAEVAVSDRGGWLAVDRTAVVRVPTNTTAPSAATTFVQPLSTPGSASGLLSAEALALATADSGALSRALTASAGRPVLLGIDPRVIVSIRALGDQAPPSALSFLERLVAVPNESFLLPWADADPVASIDAGLGVLPPPEGSGQPMNGPLAVDAGATSAPSAEPTDSPAGPVAGATTTPIAGLLDWTPTLDNVSWPEVAGLSAEALDALADDGVRTVVTPSTVLVGDDPVQRRGDVLLIRADTALSEAARAATAASSQQQFDRAMARVSSLLAAAAAADPGAPAIIALSRESSRTSDRLLDTLAQTISLPWSTGSTLASALTRPAPVAEVSAAAATDASRSAVQAAIEAEAADRQFAQIALTPALITDLRRLELLAALSLGWGDGSLTALEGFVADSRLLRSSVQVVESSAILLLTDRATLPVTVQNDLDVAVQVFVRVEPDTAQLRVLDSTVEAIVEPRSQSRVLVPVESLTNGDVDITVTVRDAQGRVLSDPTRVALSLQAGWETAGTIIAAGAIVVLFVVGIVRDLRKRSRRPEDAGDDAGASVSGEGGIR